MTPLAYPKSYSEFEVHAHLYMRLLQEGHNVRGEVHDKPNKSRYDLVVYDADNVACVIVEVKNHKRVKNYNKPYQTKQVVRYKQRGIPVSTCFAMWDVDNTVAFVNDYMSRIY